MNLLLFITVFVISFIIVRTGAIAFQLTGLEWSQAKFQALSCFTSTGFTTKEAELVTGDKQRRRIASLHSAVRVSLCDLVRSDCLESGRIFL